MATRQLSDYEIIDFLNTHPDVNAQVNAFQNLYTAQDHPYQYNQILAAQQLDDSLYPIPPRGVAVANDPSYGNVVVFPDASGILHFVATDNAPLVAQIQKPVYISDPAYFDMFADWAKRFREMLPTFPQLDFGLGAIAVIAVVVALFVFAPRPR